jgi:hypothetical protein
MAKKASVQAIVVIRSSLTGETFQLTTAADGNFTFSGLAPGDYQLYAISATGQSSQLSDPPTDEKTGTRVALNPNGTDYFVFPLTD